MVTSTFWDFMTSYLYKVSPPRGDLLFHPTTFWHSPDWESSSDRYRAGFIKDSVLYAGDFDEVSIHLFPRVRTVRVRARDADHSVLQNNGLRCAPGKSAYIFCASAYRDQVESFTPTIFTFKPDGFVQVRNGEYVSWTPQCALSCQTLILTDAIITWNLQACFVDDLDAVITTLASARLYFDEQSAS